MKSKIAAALVAAVTLGATFAAGTTQAQAHWHGHGWGWGAAGLGFAIGAAAAAATYDGPRCWLQPQYDRFGNYIGRVRVCNY